MLRQGQGKSLKEKLQKYKKGKNSRGIPWDTVYKKQLPHRLSRLFEAHTFYDSTFKPIYEEHKDLFDSYDDFLETIFNGNPAMLKQYRTSQAASNWLAEMSEKYPGQNIFQLLTNPEIFGEDILYPGEWGGKDISAEGMNLFSLIRDIAKENPDLLKDKGMLSEFEHQMSGRKLDYWGEHNERSRLLGMVPIDNLLHFYNKDESEKAYTETGRVLGMITSQGLAGKLLSKGRSLIDDEDLTDVTYEMFGKDSELFKDIQSVFEHQYGMWHGKKLDEIWDMDLTPEQEQRMLSRAAFLKTKQGQAFLGESTTRVNKLISRYNARNNFMSDVMGPIIQENFGIAKEQELKEIEERHEREEAQAAEEEKRRLAEEAAREVIDEVVEEVVKKPKSTSSKKKSTKKGGTKTTTKGTELAEVIADSHDAPPGGPGGPGGGNTYISGDPINIEHIDKATIKAETIVQNITGGIGGSGDGGSKGGKGGKKGDEVKVEGGERKLTSSEEKRLIYDTRMADYYYRTYTDLDYQQYTIQQAKAKEVSQAKIEMYEVQLKEIEYQKKLALDQYNEYKRGHAGVDYDTVEGKRQSILAQKKAAFWTGQKEQTNLFNQIDVRALQWFKRMMEGGLILKFLQLARQGIRRVVNEAKQLDQVMTNLRIVTNANRDEASTMINTYSELAKQLGATTKEVASSANEWFNGSRDHSKINFFNCWEFLRVYVTTI